MRIKSFFASSVDAALCEARRELGPEAMLIESRRSAPEARRFGDYEVVCAVTTPGAAPAAKPREAGGGGLRAERKPEANLPNGVEALAGRLERLAYALHRAESIALRLGVSAELEPAVRELEAAEVDPEWIAVILSRAAAAGAPPSAEQSSPLDRILSAIASLIPVEPKLGPGNSLRQIVAVIGPPGGGKTTALVKMAARHAVAARRPSLVISADTQRVGATEQLRSFASILGAGFVAVESVRALRQTLDEHPGKEWVWIDTPGWSRDDASDGQALMECLASLPGIDTHLVLPASMRTGDLAECTGRFLIAAPAKLLFTRLDETRVYGPILNECARTGLPLSFFSTGPRIPEDLTTAGSEQVAGWILGVSPVGRAASAAA